MFVKGIQENLIRKKAPFEPRCAYNDSSRQQRIDLLSCATNLGLRGKRSRRHISLGFH